MRLGDYVLSDDEYEVVETGESRPITSEEVIDKLDHRSLGPIEQSDFDEKDYTVSDYFWIDDDQFPRNFRERPGMAAGMMGGIGVSEGAKYVLSGEVADLPELVFAVGTASYVIGLYTQDKEFGEALKNSVEF